MKATASRRITPWPTSGATSAAEQGDADARKNRDAVAGELDDASLAEAQRLSKEYFKRYVEPFQ